MPAVLEYHSKPFGSLIPQCYDEPLGHAARSGEPVQHNDSPVVDIGKGRISRQEHLSRRLT